jgi:predicted Zn-dependent protease
VKTKWLSHLDYNPSYQLNTIVKAGEKENYDYDANVRLTLIQRDGKTVHIVTSNLYFAEKPDLLGQAEESCKISVTFVSRSYQK